MGHKLLVVPFVIWFAGCVAGAAADESAPSDAAASAQALHRRCHAPTPPPAPTPPSSECLFGEVFSDIRTNALLELQSETWIRTLEGLPEAQGQQLLRAVQQSSHSDVTTPAEALERVDQQEVRLIELVELTSGRAFRVFEYGAGDNSYGAFFERESPEVVASIHDGDLLDCNVTARP